MSATDSLALGVTLHTETVSSVSVLDLRTDARSLVRLELGDDRSGVRLLGDHGQVLGLVVRAALELLRVHDPDDQSDELQALAHLITTGEEPRKCELCCDPVESDPNGAWCDACIVEHRDEYNQPGNSD